MTTLKINQISLSRQGRAILKNVSLEIKAGEVIGLVGPNGSGKSTLLKALSGVLPFDSGEVLMGSKNLFQLDPQSRAQAVTYVGSEFNSDFPITAFEGVRLGDYPRSFSIKPLTDDSRLESLMREFGCWDYREQRIHSLSSGERQRVALARAFYQAPKIIFLDESVTQLDLHHQTRIGNILKKYLKSGMSFVLVSHDLNFTAQCSDRLIFIKNGQIVADGATSEVLTEKNLKILYPDAEFDFSNNPRTGHQVVHFRSSSDT